MKKILILLTVSFCFISSLFSQSHFSSEAHQESVSCVKPIISKSNGETSFITAGGDGFLIKWSEDDMGEHYQVSDIGITLMATSPNGKFVAVCESDGGSVNKVTVWDWTKLTRKYQLKLKESVTSLAFSTKGTYLIIGTATIDGAIFIKTSEGSDWTKVDKVKENTSIVNFIKTSNTEKTAVMYSPSGTLTYYNIQNGKTTAKFNCVQGLSNITMFCNDLFLAGIKDNYIYIIQATTGKTLQTIPCSDPIILSSDEDNLYYLEYDGKNIYELKMVEKISNSVLSNQRIVKGLKGPRGEGQISCGTKFGSDIYFGSSNGSVYKANSSPSGNIENMTNLTQNIYSKIYDIDENGDEFYFLTKDSVFQVDYNTGNVNKVAPTSGENTFIAYKDSFILFSKETRNPVKLVSPNGKSQVLFTPKSSIQTMHVFGDTIVEVESSSKVNIYDINKKTYKEIFSGMGVQDAVMCEDGKIYIAKSASTSPASPLISVDPVTFETLPLKVAGQVTYGLSTNGKIIYGMNLQASETGNITYVFSYNISSGTMTPILKFSEEDPDAFTYLSGNYLFTNIGKNKIYSYNISQKKRIAFDRTASMPEKISKNSKRIVILNHDGSISWATEGNTKLLADWYLTKDGQWYEF